MAGEHKERIFYAVAGVVALIAVLVAGRACDREGTTRMDECVKAGGQYVGSSCLCVPGAK